MRYTCIKRNICTRPEIQVQQRSCVLCGSSNSEPHAEPLSNWKQEYIRSALWQKSALSAELRMSFMNPPRRSHNDLECDRNPGCDDRSRAWETSVIYLSCKCKTAPRHHLSWKIKMRGCLPLRPTAGESLRIVNRHALSVHAYLWKTLKVVSLRDDLLYRICWWLRQTRAIQ